MPVPDARTVEGRQVTCTKIGNALVNLGGPLLLIDTAKGVVAFEWNSYCGPMPVSRAKGRVGSERYLPANHPFWAKVTRWIENGKVVRDGWAVME